MALLRSSLTKLEWFAHKYLVLKVEYKVSASRTMLLKAKKCLGEIFCVIVVFLISSSKLSLLQWLQFWQFCGNSDLNVATAILWKSEKLVLKGIVNLFSCDS